MLLGSSQRCARFWMTGVATTTTLSRRSTTTHFSSNAGLFDGNFANIYQQIAEQHRHPNGPWRLMTEKVQTYATTMPNPMILDLASGPGEPAATIAKAIPTATVLSTDFSEEMVLKAQGTSENIPNMQAKIADMTSLDFEDETFDIVTCCYGFMFPPNKDQALREAYRVLKPGGVLVATTWDFLPISEVSRKLLACVLDGVEPPRPSIDPLSLAMPGHFESMVVKAGFHDIQTSQSAYEFDYGVDTETQFQMATLTIKDQLSDVVGGMERARSSFDTVFNQYAKEHEGRKIISGNTFKLSVAKKSVPLPF